MPLKTDLNVTPYYDDFDKSKNFHQVLSRPAYAVQARELTQMQSILKNQIESLGNFALSEGSMVIPGSLSVIMPFPCIKLETTFGGATIDVTRYTDEIIVTGLTSGVKAMVLHKEVGTDDDPPTLFLKYVSVGTDNVSTTFQAGESLSAEIAVTHGTTVFAADNASMKVVDTALAAPGGLAGPAAEATGVQIEAGVFWIRGSFIETEKQVVILSKYTRFGEGRVGFEISESIITPENDSTLLDNASGTSNFAAKGAHRLKIEATLKVLPIGSTDDDNFVELVTLLKGVAQNRVKTKLGGILETLAQRTYEESGNYTVRPFTFEVKESVTLNENEGIYTKGETTRFGGTASNDLLALKVSSGKAFIRGYDVEKTVSNVIDIPKARDINSVNSAVTTYDVGNFLNITNLYGSPDISFISGETTPYKQISLFDTEK